MAENKTAIIRRMNDELRWLTVRGCALGSIVMTSTITNREAKLQAALMCKVMTFEAFNDPYDEHDFAMFDHEGETWFFKIDYYDTDYRYGSPDPSDATLTRRVLTIGHMSDY